MTTVYMIRDRQERINSRGQGWFVNAYRVVDENNRDLVQPWFNTKGEAKKYAKTKGYHLIDRTE